MKHIAVVCGAGVATSSVIRKRLEAHYDVQGIAVNVTQATVMDLLSPQFSADAIVTTVTIPSSIGIPQLSGMPLLLGTNSRVTFKALDELLGFDSTNGDSAGA